MAHLFKTKFNNKLPILLSSLLLFSCKEKNQKENNTSLTRSNTYEIPYTIIKIYLHDTSSYTQGLIYTNNNIYESTGLEGKSIIREYSLKNGEIKKQIKISDNNVFGEGIAIFKEKIYQLTWQSHIVYQYDIKSLKQLKIFSWPYEGWGITTDNKYLIISTGSSTLYYVDPNTFSIVKSLNVKGQDGNNIDYLNELEYVNGYIYANKYLTDTILKIDSKTGLVDRIINLKEILQQSGFNYELSKYETNTGNVLNGIAYDSLSNTFFITGKKWPALFEIKLNE